MGFAQTQFIDWDKVPRVGVPVIDFEHQQLVIIINKLYNSVTSGVVSRSELLQIMLDLFDYTVYHFTAENKIMVEVGYPQAEQHSKKHESLQEQILDFASSFFEYEVDVREDLLQVLKTWLVEHIVKSDQPIKQHLVKCGIDPNRFAHSETQKNEKKALTLTDAFLEIKKNRSEIAKLRSEISALERQLRNSNKKNS
ncbi:MAG: hemerythrin family protein [Magnetococcales bacterium]|nr:hemerythrin family protein [Magnetococcales bacterium]